EARGDVIVTRARTPQGPVPGSEVFVEAAPGQGDNFVFISSEMSIDGKVVKGAPYAAQAVTESVQTLGDGNRIVRKNTANVYRDSEGRTRRDQTLGTIGPFAAQGDPPQTVFINDPVAGITYILDPRSRSARKLPRFEYKVEFGAKDKEQAELKMKEHSELRLRTPGHGAEMETHGFFFRTPGPGGPGPEVHFFGDSSKANANTEKLAAQMVEGVMAEGTRTTVTIPAGEIGNEQPIQIVSERWYSPELQTVVMTRHSDPRFGENTYKLTNITRTEPAPTLFQVPGDYTVREVGPLMRKMRGPGLPKKAPEVQ
ncbi:MAG TPA: hypothetical protein VE360_05685, partial [Pyrinomonadaceae bacterium]|nr:hypothetical protein [Pyrinomonadaceae bacterium]